MGYYGRGGHSRIGNATHEQTIQAWLDGRDLRGSRMFSERGKIYSYGYHFVIATWAETRDGERVALLTRDSYSSKTAGHISGVASAARRAGVNLIHSHNMNASDTSRHGDAIKFARDAVDLMHEKRLSSDLDIARQAESKMTTAREHERLYGSPIPELDTIAADFARAVQAHEERCAQLFYKRTAKELAKLFAYEGVLGQFVSAGAYAVPDREGKMQRRLCAYWRLSDGRFARMAKEYGGIETAFLSALPADLTKGA